MDTRFNPARKAQVQVLRRRCLVETVTCLHRVLHETEQYREVESFKPHYEILMCHQCLQLADVVAAEKYGLCQVFAQETDELRKLLVLLRSSALALLENHADPLGYL